MIKKAVIPAAGLGTRLLPATKAQPKEMLIVGKKPVIHYVVDEAIEAGIEDILIITGKHKRALEDYFDSYHSKAILESKGKQDKLAELNDIETLDCNIHYRRQKEPKGLGDAVLHAESFVNNEDFAVLLGDSFFYPDKTCLKKMADINKKHGAGVIATERLPEKRIPSHGILEVNKREEKLYDIVDAIEKPQISEAPSNIGIGPRYILPNTIFEALRNTEPGKGNEIQLTDAIVKIIKEHNEQVLAHIYDQKRYHISDHETYQRAFLELSQHKPETS